MLRYRYLFEQMVRRELRQKYKGSVLGVLWYVVNPLVLMGAYAVMFGVLLKAVSIDDYPLFLFVGLIVWLFFSQSLLAAATSLLDQASLVGKVRFPRETVPASVVTVQLVTFLVLLVAVAPFVEGVRSVLYDGAAPAAGVLVYVPVAAAVALVGGWALFRRMQPELAVVL